MGAAKYQFRTFQTMTQPGKQDPAGVLHRLHLQSSTTLGQMDKPSHPLRYVFRSCVLSVCWGLGQFWPYFLPVIRAKHLARDFCVRQPLNARAFLDWHSTRFPVSNCGDRHIQAICQCTSAPDNPRSSVYRMLSCFFICGFHLSILTRNVLTNQICSAVRDSRAAGWLRHQR